MSFDGSPSEERPRAARRAFKWAAVTLLGLVLALGAALASLPFVAPRYAESEHARATLRELAREEGIELDYDRLRLDPLEGRLVIEGLRLRSPPPFDEIEPEWLRLARLELEWSVSELFSGRVKVSRLHLEGLRLDEVIDGAGRSSVDAALEALSDPDAPEEEPAPLSHTLASLELPLPVRVEELRVRDVVLRRSSLAPGGAREVLAIEGLELAGELRAGEGPPHIALELGSPEGPGRTQIALEAGADRREAELGVRVSLKSEGGSALALEAGVTLERQRFDETLELSGELLDLAAEVSFDAEAGASRLAITRASLLGGAARAELAATLRDDALLPELEGGEVLVELDPIARAFPGLFEGVEAPGATARLQVLPRAEDEAIARLELEARAPRVVLASEDGAIELGAIELALGGDVGGPSSTLEGRLEAGPIAIREGGDRTLLPSLEAGVRVEGLTADLGAPLSISLTGALPRVELRSSEGARTVLYDVDLRLAARDARLDLDAPEASRAKLEAELRAGRVELSEEGSRLRVTGLELTAAGDYEGHAPSAIAGSLGLRALYVQEPERPEVRLLSPGRLRYRVSGLTLDADEPLASSGRVRAEGGFSPFFVELDAHLEGGEGELAFHLRTRSLERVLELLDVAPPEEVEVDEAGFDLKIRGRFRRLLSPAPELEQRAIAKLSRLAFHERGVDVVIPKATLVAEHRGVGARHRGTLRATLESPTLNGHPYEVPIALEAEGSVDLARLSGGIEAKMSGPEELSATLDASGAVDSAGVLSHEASFRAARLGALASLIPLSTLEEHPIDLDTLELELDSKGTIAGALTADRSALVEGWEAKSHIEETGSLRLRGVRYAPQGLELELPELHLGLELESDPAGSSIEATLAIPLLDAEDPESHHVTLHGFEQHFHVRADGALAERRLEIETDGGIARIEQDVVPSYPAEDVELGLRLVMDGFESMELERFVIANERGGTRLEMTKSLGRSDARRSDGSRVRGAQHLSLRGELTQDLEKLDGSPSTFRGSGKIEGPFSVDSADGSLFRVHAALESERVDMELPELGVRVVGLRGRVPLEEAIEWDPEHGVILVPSTGRSAFSRVRFQDVQHSLSTDAFVEAERVHYGDVELGPARASLRVDRNVFYMDGIRVEKGEALITGQVVVDYVPGAELVSFRGNVTGLRPEGSDEPLDANAAVVFDPNRLDLDGRIQIVRIGKTHLRQMIDMIDPYREDGALNTLRRALKLAYPKRVGVRLSDGLMSLNVKLGGVLGSLVRIGEIQGIALGPFMTRHVAPALEGDESTE